MERKGVQRLTSTIGAGLALGLLVCWAVPVVATESPAMRKETSEDDARDMVVKTYIQSCQGQAKKDAACEKIRKEAAAVLKEDLLTLGSSADPKYLPIVAKVLQSDEAELRAAAADAMGMIRPTPAETTALMAIVNDPIPLVRNAALRALGASSDPQARLLARRGRQSPGSAVAPEPAPDARRLGIPIYAGATFLHFASEVNAGRAAFATPDPVPAVIQFYRASAKHPPISTEQFSKTYPVTPPRDPAAENRAFQELQTRMERLMQEHVAGIQKALQQGRSFEQDPDFKRREAEIEKIQEEMKTLTEQMVRQQTERLMPQLLGMEYADSALYGAATFIVLEETGAGGARRPTRFVVVFEDRALKRTGFVLHLPPVGPPSPIPTKTRP